LYGFPGRVKSRLVGSGSMPLISMSSGLGRGLSSTAAMAISTGYSTGFLGCRFLAIIILRPRAGEGGAEIQDCLLDLIAPDRTRRA